MTTSSRNPTRTRHRPWISRRRRRALDRQIVLAVFREQERTGRGPTLRELMGITGLRSTSSIRYRVRNLVALDVLTDDVGKERTLRLGSRGAVALVAGRPWAGRVLYP